MKGLKYLEIPPLSNGDIFEDLCRDLYEKVWLGIHDFKKNGRSGQRQNGVDIVGRKGREWYGVQAKKKGHGKNLKENEVQKEIEDAKKFKPPLKHLTIATTAPRDARIQEYVRVQNDANLDKGLFSVSIDSWDDILGYLNKHCDVFEKYYSYLLPQQTSPDNFKINIEQKNIISNKMNTVVQIPQHGEHHAKLDQIKTLLEDNQPNTAKRLLENLKEEIWDKADSDIKYRIITNLGLSELNIGNESTSAKFFIQALQFKDKDEDALTNAAAGCWTLGDRNKAREYCKKCLNLNSTNSRAYQILLQMEDESKSFEELLQIVPKHLQNSKEITTALSSVAFRRKDFKVALSWARKSQNKITNDIEMSDYLATLLITIGQNSVRERMSTKVLGEEKILVEEAEKILETFIQDKKNEELARFRPWWFVNLISAKLLLEKISEAEKLITQTLERFPENEKVLDQAVNVFARVNKIDLLIDTLEKLRTFKEDPSSLRVLAELYIIKEDYDESENILTNICGIDNISEKELEGVENLRLSLDLKQNKYQSAEVKIQKSLTKNPRDIPKLLFKAYIYSKQNKKNEAIDVLKKAYRCVTDKLEPIYISHLANALFEKHLWVEASDLYEKLIGDSVSHPCIYSLIHCYYQKGMFDKVIDSCRIILQKDSKSIFATEMLFYVYESIGDLNKAKEICLTYLVEEPNDAKMNLRLAIIAKRNNDFTLLENILNKELCFKNLEFEHVTLYASLLLEAKYYLRAIKTQYYALKKFFHESRAHLRYINIFLDVNNKNKTFGKKNIIDIDCAVKIQFENKKIETFVLVESKTRSQIEKEIDENDRLYTLLKGKRINNYIELPRTGGSTTAKIIEIKDKYLSAFRKVSSEYNFNFPTETDFEAISLPSDFSQPLSGRFKELLEAGGEENKRKIQVLNMYKNQQVTIGGVSGLLNKTYIEVCGYLILSDQVKIIDSLGNHEDDVFSKESINVSNEAVLELSFILVVHWLKIEEHLTSLFKKLLVPQSTLEELRTTIKQNELLYSDYGLLTAWSENGKLSTDHISPEKIKKYIASLTNIEQWILNTCEIIPIPTDIGISQDEREQMTKVLQAHSFNSILCSKPKGRVLLSVDFLLRVLARNYGEIASSGVKTTLDVLLEKKIISKDVFDNKIIELISMNFSFIPVNSEILMKAIQKDGYIPGHNYKSAIQLLSISGIELAISVTVNFTIDFWQSSLLPLSRDNILLMLYNEIYKNHKPSHIGSFLKELIHKKLWVQPLRANEIVGFIDSWVKTKSIQ